MIEKNKLYMWQNTTVRAIDNHSFIDTKQVITCLCGSDEIEFREPTATELLAATLLGQIPSTDNP